MFVKKGKILTAMLSLVLLVSFCVQPIYSAQIVTDPEIIQPQWQHVSGTALVLNLEDYDKILIQVTMGGRSGTTYANGTVTLTKLTGTNVGLVKRWTNLSSSGPTFTFRDMSITPTSGKYKLLVSITTTRNGVSEIVSISKEATY